VTCPHNGREKPKKEVTQVGTYKCFKTDDIFYFFCGAFCVTVHRDVEERDEKKLRNKSNGIGFFV
jgi:hypothetical protein